MSDITFSCPHCEQHIACDADYRGQQTKCPTCDTDITIPLATSPLPLPQQLVRDTSSATVTPSPSPASPPSPAMAKPQCPHCNSSDLEQKLSLVYESITVAINLVIATLMTILAYSAFPQIREWGLPKGVVFAVNFAISYANIHPKVVSYRCKGCGKKF